MILPARFRFLAVLSVLFFVCTGLLFTPLNAAEVDPGRASSFMVESPGVAQAGNPFQVSIKVLDGEGNLVRNYDQLNRTLTLHARGTGSLSQDTVSSKQFSNGKLSLSLTYDQAEEIQVEVQESQHVARGISDEMLVRPGRPAGFQIKTPEEARAGEPFSIELVAEDRFGNRVKNYNETTNGLLLETNGVESPSPAFLSVSDFRRGRLQTQISYEVAETIRVTIIDEVNSIRERSDPVTVQPGSLREFTVSVPNRAIAGEPFQAAIEAKDRFGNIVTDYPEKGRGVDIYPDGEGDLDPVYLPPEDFSGGVAFTEFTYTRTDPLRIRVQDRAAAAEGLSDRISVQSGSPAAFVVKAPDEIQAGEDFDVRVEVQDRFGNRVRRYNQIGQAVQVSVTGFPGSAEQITRDQFEEARATVTLTQTQAGTVRVGASVAQGESELSGVSEQIVVVPGPPGRLAISTPSEVNAGDNFPVSLELQDEFGNTIRNTEDLSGQLFVSVLDHGAQTEKRLRARELIKGEHQLSFSHTRAEEITIYAELRSHDIRSQSRSIQVTPASFDHFAIRTPGEVRAGRSFTIGMQMRDQYGNPLQTMPDNLDPIHLFSTGSDNLEPVVITRGEMSVPNFTISARYYISESMALEIRDRSGRQVGVSPPVRVTPAALAGFRVDVPDQARATEGFPARLEAVDQYNNVITNLNQRDGEVIIASTGTADVSPGVVPYSQFINGVSELNFDYRNAESIRLMVRANGVESESPEIDIVPGPPETFDVGMRSRVVAGEPFPGVIEVYDRYDNRITELPDSFHGVRLESSGSHRISPGRIDRSLFSGGRAEIYMAYPRTGTLDVSARPLSQSTQPPTLERFYVQRDRQTARLHLLSSHRVPARLEQSPGADRLQVVAQPAELVSTREPVQYNDWFIKRIDQKQVRFQPLPNVVLSIFPRKRVQSQTNFNQNLFTLELSATDNGPVETVTLEEIRGLIDDERYQAASTQLSRYLERYPDDQRAIQLRHRLERVRELMSQ